MRQIDLITYLNRETHISRDQIRSLLHALTKYFYIAIARKDVFNLGFGKFELYIKKPQQGMDWRTKTRITIPAAYAIRFRPSGLLEAILKEHSVNLPENQDAKEKE